MTQHQEILFFIMLHEYFVPVALSVTMTITSVPGSSLYGESGGRGLFGSQFKNSSIEDVCPTYFLPSKYHAKSYSSSDGGISLPSKTT